jgi:7-cyano-7-deazaguanine reductase
MKKTNPREFKQLGKTSKQIYDNPDPALLECFPSPFSGKANVNGVVGTIHIEAPEFTTLCPITGQPDFATIVIDYEPDKLCVESKSLKLYLGAFRQFPEFHEASVNRIANDLISLLKPRYIKVEGRFTPRVGISFWPTAEWRAKDRKPSVRPAAKDRARAKSR